MATILGTVVQITLEKDITKQAGGTYKGWELIYTDKNSGEVRNIRKPVQSLRFNGLGEKLKSLEAGNDFTMVTEKNDAGFLNVTDISNGHSAAPTPAAKPATSSGSRYNNDDARQKLIVRQSSLTRALETLNVGAKKPVPSSEVISLAEIYTDYVFNGESKDAKVVSAEYDPTDDVPM